LSCSKLKIVTNKTIFSNINELIYASVNKGVSWVKMSGINGSDIFTKTGVYVKGSTDVPGGTLNAKFVVLAAYGKVYLYKQTDADLISINIDSYNISPELLLKDCVSARINAGNYELFISEKYRINKFIINNSMIVIGYSKIAENTINTSYEIQYPLTLSKYDNNAMCFVSKDKYYLSVDGMNFISRDLNVLMNIPAFNRITIKCRYIHQDI
jgi:hypothetical protein